MTNKLVKGDSMKVVSNVYDIKVSHNDSFEVTEFAQYLLTIYGK